MRSWLRKYNSYCELVWPHVFSSLYTETHERFTGSKLPAGVNVSVNNSPVTDWQPPSLPPG